MENFYPENISTSEELFDKAKKCLIGDAFTRLVEDSVSEINYYNSYSSKILIFLTKMGLICPVFMILARKEN